MSAIFGIFYLDGRPVAPDDLERMGSCLSHLGPDGSGIWRGGSIGMGHRKLVTTPESLHERLPLADNDGGFVITADARIDNREELLHVLGFDKSEADRIADSELILSAYKKWGEKCPEKLLGDFAFAIWDGRSGTLFCARDHTSIKPFFYYRSDKLFAFASEVKGLLRLAEVPRRINDQYVPVYLHTGFSDKENTMYRDIHRLPEAATLAVTGDGRVRRSTYWSLDPDREIRFRSDEEYEEAFRSIFEEAVRCRLRSVHPVGSMLSGGLDSSSIACTARRILENRGGPPLKTLSAVFPKLGMHWPRLNEQSYMDAIIAQGGFEPLFVHIDRISPMIDTQKIMWSYDSPNPHFNTYIHWSLFKAAKEDGSGVILTGTDGDTTLSYGYEYLMQLARTGRWIKLYRESKAVARVTHKPPGLFMWRYGLRYFVPEPLRELWHAIRGKSEPPWSFIDIIRRPDCIKSELSGSGKQSIIPRPPSAREFHMAALTSAMILNIPELLGRAAGAFSIELRHPFYDRRLREFCLALPPEQKLLHGRPRSLIRRAMKGVLPPRIQERQDKGDLRPNFLHRLIEDERGRIEEAILNDGAVIENYVDLLALRAAYERYISRPMEAVQEAYAVFVATNLSIWIRNSGLA